MPTQSGSAATRRAVSSTMPMSRGSMPASTSRLNPAPTTAPIPASEENVKGANRSHAQSSRAISVAGRSAVGAEAGARSSSTCRRCSASAVLTASRSTWAERSMPDVPLAEPTRTTLSPKTRCSGDAVRSTVRMRSRGTERRSRRSQPVRSSTRSPVIR